MFGNFVTGVGRIVELVGGLSAPALLGLFVGGALICYFLPESTVSSFAVLFFSLVAGMRVYAGTHGAVWTILAFMLAGGIFTFISFIGNVKRGTVQTEPPSRPKEAATGGLLDREWTTYSSPQHGFAVSLPSAPEVHHEPGESSLFTTYSSGDDEGEVRVEVTEYPKDLLDKYGPRRILERLPAAYDGLWNIVSFDNSSEFLGNPAALVVLERNDGAVAAELACVFRDCCEYDLWAEAWDGPSNDRIAHALFRRLVESFQFVEGS